MPDSGSEERRLVPAISLRTRLTIWVVAIFVLIQLVTGLGFWYYQSATIRELFEARLHERAQSMASEIATLYPEFTALQLSALAAEQLGDIQFERFAVDVVNEAGDSLVYDEVRWPETVPDLAAEAIRSDTPRRARIIEEDPGFEIGEGKHAESIAIPMEVESGTWVAVVVVTSDAYLQRQTAFIARILIAGALIGMLASAISGWFIAGIAIEPIRRISSIAGQLRPENIDRELVVDTRNSEITELTMELEATRNKIRDAFAVQERFLSNISHEIKTPIATLLTEAQTIDRTDLPDEIADFVDTAEDEMRKLGRLVESFLTLTRVRDGSGVAKPKRYPANELLMDAVEDCMPMAEQYSVRILPELATDEDAMDAELEGDETLLRTMLNNLIRNAIRFSPRNERVTVKATLEDEQFCIAVTDLGPGLAEDIIDHVFDRYAQSTDEMRRSRGHGLGLAIAKGIAELHQGDISVRNLDGVGAEFRISLPIAE